MQSTTRIISCATAFIVLLTFSLENALAQSSLDAPTSYSELVRAQNVVAPEGTGILGETVDYYTGQTDFVATDVSLPGNSVLPVAVGRRFHVMNEAGGPLQGAFGDWDLEIPHIEGIIATDAGWTVPGGYPDERCTDFGSPPPVTVTSATSSGTVSTAVPSSEYSSGFAIVVPGKGRHELLLRASDNPYSPGGVSYPVVTNDWWQAACVHRYGAPVGTPDEAFQITSPDGVTYSFIQYMVRSYPSYQRPANTTQTGVMAVVPRQQAWLLPTQVTDRFGNKVLYDYQTTSAGQLILNTITAQDNYNADTRKITLTWSTDFANKVVTSINDQLNTWHYVYTNSQLTNVTLPDSSYWTITFANLNKASWNYTNATCSTLPSPTYPTGSSISNGTVSGTIAGPTGASGVFTFTVTRHGRNSAPTTCLQNTAGLQFARVEPSVYDVLSLTKKVLTGPNVSAMTWTTAYGGCSATACNATKTTKITDARGYDTNYTFGALYSTNANTDTEGQLQTVQSGGISGLNYLRTDSYLYFPATGQAYPSVAGTPAQTRGDVSALTTLRPVSKRTTTQDGATYTQSVSSSDQYGFPSSITRTGTDTKTDTYSYHHDTSAWVLGTVTELDGNGTQEVKVTLYTNDLPQYVYRFGRLDRTFSYNSDGTVSSVTDGSSNKTTFGTYFRGVPTTTSYGDGGHESVGVNNYGELTQWTDANNFLTKYSFDLMHRLNGITGPDPLNQTTITTSTPQSGWSSSETHGAYTKFTAYDALLRPITINEGAGLRTRTFKYDADGRTTFASYPGSAGGITYTFDGLGRLTQAKDVAGNTTTFTPASNSLAVKDADGHTTTYNYKNYDTPSAAWPKSIVTPFYTSTVTTTINRDAWGKPLTIVRGGITRTRSYNANQLLQTSTDPESGSTSFTYYGAGNLKTVTRSDNVIETRAYDGRERLTTRTFSNSDPTVTLSWNKNGTLNSASRASYSQNESYDVTSGYLTSEVTNTGSASYTVRYGYDHFGVRTSLTYPDNSVVSYSPDALGRPTIVGTYATHILYYPNDALKSFAYGNGIVHSMNQYSDGRPLPGEISEPGVMDYSYTYDGLANPLTIVDHLGGTNNKTLTYDTSNRLRTAAAPNLWGTETFTYDNLDNLTTEIYGTTTLTYSVDAVSNRLTSMSGGPLSYSLGYDSKGNITSKSGNPSTFNASNQLTATVQPLLNYRCCIYNRTGQYDYDGLGNNISKYYTESDYTLSRSITTISVHSQNRTLYNIVANTTADPPNPPNVSTSYVKFIYLGAHLVAKDFTDGTPADEYVTYQHTDSLGTPVAQTDSSQNVVASGQNFPFGQWYQGGDGGQPGFASGYEDGTGLVNFRARSYDPYLRRFIGADPADVDSTTGLNFNRYSYALNSPYAKYDPSGRQAVDAANPERFYKTNSEAQFVAFACMCNPFSRNAPGDDSITPTGSPLDLFAPSLVSRGAALWADLSANFASDLLTSTTESVSQVPVYVIGRAADVEPFVGQPGYATNIGDPNWTPAQNFQWVQGGINDNATFQLASPLVEDNIYNGGAYNGGYTIFSEEISQVLGADYTMDGSEFLTPPDDN